MTCPEAYDAPVRSLPGKYARNEADDDAEDDRRPRRRSSAQRRRRSRGSFCSSGLRRNPNNGGQLAREDSLSSFSSLQGNSDTSPLRRSFSDTLVGRDNSSRANVVPRTNATFHVAQRSGAPLVREMIAAIEEKTSAFTRSNGDAPSVRRNDTADDFAEEAGEEAAASSPSPESDLTALANCALDPYYRVIISASSGLPAIVRAMSAFSGREEVQASGCAALASVCAKNRSNQISAGMQGGLGAVLRAMRAHPSSVSVQSAGCDALASLTSLAAANAEMLRSADDFDDVMERAMGGFLPPSCREGAEAVLRRVRC